MVRCPFFRFDPTKLGGLGHSVKQHRVSLSPRSSLGLYRSTINTHTVLTFALGDAQQTCSLVSGHTHCSLYMYSFCIQQCIGIAYETMYLTEIKNLKEGGLDLALSPCCSGAYSNKNNLILHLNSEAFSSIQDIPRFIPWAGAAFLITSDEETELGSLVGLR